MAYQEVSPALGKRDTALESIYERLSNISTSAATLLSNLNTIAGVCFGEEPPSTSNAAPRPVRPGKFGDIEDLLDGIDSRLSCLNDVAERLSRIA